MSFLDELVVALNYAYTKSQYNAPSDGILLVAYALGEMIVGFVADVKPFFTQAGHELSEENHMIFWNPPVWQGAEIFH